MSALTSLGWRLPPTSTSPTIGWPAESWSRIAVSRKPNRSAKYRSSGTCMWPITLRILGCSEACQASRSLVSCVFSWNSQRRERFRAARTPSKLGTPAVDLLVCCTRKSRAHCQSFERSLVWSVWTGCGKVNALAQKCDLEGLEKGGFRALFF